MYGNVSRLWFDAAKLQRFYGAKAAPLTKRRGILRRQRNEKVTVPPSHFNCWSKPFGLGPLRGYPT